MSFSLSKRYFLLYSMLFLFFCFYTNAQKYQKFSFDFPMMGTQFKIQYFDKDSLKFIFFKKAIIQKTNEINLSLSDYRADSEINLKIKNVGIESDLSLILQEVLIESQKAYFFSNGFFDVTIGPSSQLWRRMKRQKILFSDSLIALNRNKIGFEKLGFNPLKQTINPQLKGMQLDFGGIAKGYTLDKIANIFKENDIDKFYIEAGGNILLGKSNIKKGWPIEINHQLFFLKNKAISTSGDEFQFVEIDGQRFSHILNPKTGTGMKTSCSVTVIGKSGIETDWQSTTICLLDSKQKLVKKPLRLIKKLLNERN